MNGLSKKGLRFTRIAADNWRNFSHLDVGLQQRVFLAGPNASGKSNLLDIFRFLHDLVAVGGGFQEAVHKRGGVTKLRSLSARRYPDIAIRIAIGDGEHPNAWEYELHFSQEDNNRRPVVEKEVVRRPGEVILERPDDDDRSDPARLSQTFLEQVNANRQFRDVAEFFETVRYLHVVPQLVREPDRSVGKKNDPYGGDFLEQIAQTPERVQNARLGKILDALRFAVPQLEKLQMERDERGTPHLQGKYGHWRPAGAWQAEDQFSDGTLRLMGLLWALLDGSGPLLLEEPELSLHSEVIRFVPQLFARMQSRTGRQTIVSTHSSELLGDPGIGLDEVLLLIPGDEGTSVSTASQHEDIRVLLQGGLNLAEAIIPRTRPDRADQLVLFGEESN